MRGLANSAENLDRPIDYLGLQRLHQGGDHGSSLACGAVALASASLGCGTLFGGGRARHYDRGLRDGDSENEGHQGETASQKESIG